MAKRVLPFESKYKPAITFVINLPIRFSISTNMDKEQIKKFGFQFSLANKNAGMSTFLRNFVYKRIGVKNDNEFEIFLDNEIKECKEKIYKKMGVDREHSFSSMLMSDINSYLKKNEMNN